MQLKLLQIQPMGDVFPIQHAPPKKQLGLVGRPAGPRGIATTDQQLRTNGQSGVPGAGPTKNIITQLVMMLWLIAT